MRAKNIFQTDFPEYDKLLAFIPIEKAQSYFGLESKITGLLVNAFRLEWENKISKSS